MPCFSQPIRVEQTPEQRRAEVRKVITDIDKLIAKRKIGLKVGPQGAVAFIGLTEAQRAGMTDVCVYNLLMQRGSESMKTAVRTAEMLAGRGVSQTALKAGIHTHDGGGSWHPRG
jgi:ethanolamine utilization microcompartment shell protein EutL